MDLVRAGFPALQVIKYSFDSKPAPSYLPQMRVVSNSMTNFYNPHLGETSEGQRGRVPLPL